MIGCVQHHHQQQQRRGQWWCLYGSSGVFLIKLKCAHGKFLSRSCPRFPLLPAGYNSSIFCYGQVSGTACGEEGWRWTRMHATPHHCATLTAVCLAGQGQMGRGCWLVHTSPLLVSGHPFPPPPLLATCQTGAGKTWTMMGRLDQAHANEVGGQGRKGMQARCRQGAQPAAPACPWRLPLCAWQPACSIPKKSRPAWAYPANA